MNKISKKKDKTKNNIESLASSKFIFTNVQEKLSKKTFNNINKDIKKQKGGQNIVEGIVDLINAFGTLGQSIKGEIDLIMHTRQDLNAGSDPAPGESK
jgi:hypothetical protein